MTLLRGRLSTLDFSDGSDGGRLPPVHPGEILLEEFMKPLGMSQYRLAGLIHVPALRISQIVRGKRSVTADTALRLSRLFGTTAEFWLDLQSRHDLELLRNTADGEILARIHPLHAA
ncbi:MAG: HigA family addiction module antidote protein [Magnetococcales bacterium]|nr:HigA family addiction module antidote protein [Magnetococcales bacterium]